jgi:undecaprenyl diphosphate synthase
LQKLIKKGGRTHVLGDLKAFPDDIQKGITKVIEDSKDNTKIHVNIALNYGGRAEIIHAVQQIVSENIAKENITEELLSQHLYTRGQPDPDLIIRTGGMQRLSGYLPWQSIYSELYFTDTYWPDFNAEAFDKAIEEYERRERRFGK